MKSDFCFVYGTLLRGFGNHWILLKLGGEFQGEATTVERYPLVVTDLPYLLDRPGEGYRVEGEIFRIPSAGWEALDRLEGHPHFYRRRIEQFSMGEEMVWAWTYFLALEAPGLCRRPRLRKFSEAGKVRDIT